MNSIEIVAALPIIFIAGFSLIVLVMVALLKKSEKPSYIVSVIGLVICIPVSLATIDLTGTVFNKMVNVGGSGSFFAAIFSAAALLTVILSRDCLRREHTDFG